MQSATSHLKLNIAGPGDVAQFVECMSSLEFNHQQDIKLGRGAHTFNPGTQKTEARETDIQSHIQLYSAFEPILDS